MGSYLWAAIYFFAMTLRVNDSALQCTVGTGTAEPVEARWVLPDIDGGAASNRALADIDGDDELVALDLVRDVVHGGCPRLEDDRVRVIAGCFEAKQTPAA